MNGNGIAVAGNILVDVINKVSKYPNEGELTQILSVSRAVGGCVPNVAIDLKRLAPDLTVLAYGKVSDDDIGEYAVNIIKENNVDIKNVIVSQRDKTSFTQVISIDGGQRTFFTYPGTSSDFGIDDIDFENFKADILHLGYFLLLQKIDDGEGELILKKANSLGIKTSIDLVSENSDRYLKILPVLKYTDYLIINELEGAKLTGIEQTIDNIPEIAKRLLMLGVREKVIIHYKEGAVCADKSGTLTQIESINLPTGYIKGTTGAGDAFCAGALLAIYNNLSDNDILNFGRIAAAMSLSQPDATSGLVTIGEAIKFVSQLERK